MRTFFEWFRDERIDADETWLILGKGPSFAKRHNYDLSRFRTVSLNHAVREQPVLVAHAIDLDVVDACADVIERNAGVLVMPWVPHVKNFAGPHTLGELAARHAVLRRMDEQGRLLWYNLSSADQREGDSPVVQVHSFSAEAVLNLLATAGVRHARSLGIDGGATYSNEFDDLKEKTLLANGYQSFDRQFAEIAKSISQSGIDYAPLDVEAPIRVYVGSMEDQMLAVKVLEYSICKHASMSVEVFPLHHSKIRIPMPKDARNRPRTPFSFQRFLIPALAGHRGRAIYLDSDMQVFTDIRRLWTQPLGGASLLAARSAGDTERRPQFSVMLMDCESLDWRIEEIVAALDRGELSYEQLMYEMAVAQKVSAAIDPAWNSLERFEEGVTALLHYTDMSTQPWVSREHPLNRIWTRDLFEAIDSGFISADYVREHVRRGYVRPSLLYQIEHRVEDSRHLPARASLPDVRFVAPFEAIGKSSPRWLMKGKRLLYLALRHLSHRVRLQRLGRLERALRVRAKSLLGQ